MSTQDTNLQGSRFERLFGDGRLGEEYDRAKKIHDEFGDAGEYRDSMETEVEILLLSAAEGGTEYIQRALDILERVLQTELKPLREQGFNLPLSGVAFEMLTAEMIGIG